jgi:hypothetical protein
MTQILPERRRVQLLRPSLADGLLEALNDQRHARGVPLLELDEDLLQVAETKASHQFLTGIDEEGWDYPSSMAGMFGRSLLMEVLISGPAPRMAEKLAKQTDVLDGEWISCGIGVAGGRSDQVVVAMVLCREAWDTVPAEPRRRSLLERLALGE